MFSIDFDGQTATAIRTFANAFVASVTLISFEITPDGFFLQQMLNSSIGVVQVEIAKTAFASYVCEGSHVISLNLLTLKKVIGLSKGTIRWSMEGNVGDGMSIQLPDGDVYQIKLIDLDYERLLAPEITYMFEGYLNAKQFFAKMADIANFTDDVTFSIDWSNKGVLFEGAGDECNLRGSLPFYKDRDLRGQPVALVDLDSSSDDSDDETMGDATHPIGVQKGDKFALALLTGVTKVSDMSTSFHMSLGNGNPLRILFESEGISFAVWFGCKYLE